MEARSQAPPAMVHVLFGAAAAVGKLLGLNEQQIKNYITWQSKYEKPQTIRMFFPKKRKP